MAPRQGAFALRGTFIHSPQFGSLELLSDHYCIVQDKKAGGRILDLQPAGAGDEILAKHGLHSSAVYCLPVCSCMPRLTISML
jgi:hypothetical protein